MGEQASMDAAASSSSGSVKIKQPGAELLGQNSSKAGNPACKECFQTSQWRFWRLEISSWTLNLRASRMDGSRGVWADTSSLTLPGSSS